MNWDAIGEVVGAAGVIVTLIYLPSQLKQNTRGLRAQAVEAVSIKTNSLAAFQLQYPETFSKMFSRASDTIELDDKDKLVMQSYS